MRASNGPGIVLDTEAMMAIWHCLCLQRIWTSLGTQKNTDVAPGPCEKQYDKVLGDKRREAADPVWGN